MNFWIVWKQKEWNSRRNIRRTAFLLRAGSYCCRLSLIAPLTKYAVLIFRWSALDMVDDNVVDRPLLLNQHETELFLQGLEQVHVLFARGRRPEENV